MQGTKYRFRSFAWATEIVHTESDLFGVRVPPASIADMFINMFHTIGSQQQGLKLHAQHSFQMQNGARFDDAKASASKKMACKWVSQPRVMVEHQQ